MGPRDLLGDQPGRGPHGGLSQPVAGSVDRVQIRASLPRAKPDLSLFDWPESGAEWLLVVSAAVIKTPKQGYPRDRGKFDAAYPELNSERLVFLALLHGHRPAELNQLPRCLELGCGQGFSLYLQAATDTQAQFLGLVLKAEHIAHGRALASGGALANARLALADFNSLEQQPLSHSGEIGIVTAHGMLGWVSADTGAKLLAAAAGALRPGGLFCLSYNGQLGWLAALPFQATVKLFQPHLGDGQPALDAASPSAAIASCNAAWARTDERSRRTRCGKRSPPSPPDTNRRSCRSSGSSRPSPRQRRWGQLSVGEERLHAAMPP